jgi:hypothetical protein
MRMRYYRVVMDGYYGGGMLYPPQDWPYPIARDGETVRNWQSLVLELRDGPYRHFNTCVGGANVVSEEFKEALLPYCINSDIEFLPVLVKSQEYGDRKYYIMHFLKVYDVIDKNATVYVPGTDDIIKVRLDYEKVKELDVFNAQPIVNDFYVSEKVRRVLKKNQLDIGVELCPIYCGE